MKKRYELQWLFNRSGRWNKSVYDGDAISRIGKEKLAIIYKQALQIDYRVVQKLGRKVIKVVYPKGSK